MEESALGLFEYFKITVVAIFLYVIIFIMLKKIAVVEDNKVSSTLALLTAIIVSFSGITTYIVSYAITWFAIVFFVIFLVMLVLMFMGISLSDIKSMVPGKTLAIVVGAIFLIILFKGFFGVNNTFDTSDPQENPYEVDTSFNTGVDDITETEGLLDSIFSSVDKDLVFALLFLVIIGVFVILIGK